FSYALKFARAGTDERIRDREPHSDIFGLVGGVILYREIEIGTVILKRHRDPVGSRGRLFPHKAADPGRTRRDTRFAGVSDQSFEGLAGFLFHGKCYADLAVLVLVLKAGLALRHS